MCIIYVVARQTFSFWYHVGTCRLFIAPESDVCASVNARVRTCDTEGLFSRPLLVRLSRPLSDEKRPFLRCL